MSTKKTGSKALGRCLLLLLFAMPMLLTAHPVNAGPTAYQEISITSHGNYTNVPITITTTYKIQLIDPVTGAVTTLYPNRVVSLPDGNTAVTGYTSISALDNTFTFILVANLTEGTHIYRIIFDSTLMQNSTPSYTPVGYMKSHVINPASGAGTGYQVRIKVNYGSGTDSGENVYLNGKCRSDFADIRFYDDDLTTQMSYWMEEKVDGNYAVFWVKINDDLSSSPATIYVYYGNPTLTTTTSNGMATFLLFDDFNDDVLSSNWTVLKTSASGSATESSGELKLYVPGGAWHWTAVHWNADSFTVNGGLAAVVKLKTSTNTGSFGAIVPDTTNPDPGTLQNFIFFGVNDVGNGWLTRKNSGTETFLWSESGYGTAYKTFDLRLNYIYAYLYVDGVLKFSGAHGITWGSSTSWFRLETGSGGANYGYYDYVFVRKFVSPEPSHGAWGNEFSTSNVSVTYGQISTESELTVRIPRMTFQEISVNASATWPAPENANDVMKLIAESEWGRYALVVLPIFVMLVAGSRHTAGVAGGVATGLCMGVNYMVGAELYSTLILSWIGAVCLLLIIYEARGS